MLLNQVSELVDNLSSVVSRHLPPLAFVERFASSFHGKVNILLACLFNFADDLLGDGTDDGELGS